MGGSRVFIGRLPRGCRERDIEDFFRRCGSIRNVILKRGYAFVDFKDDRDAADAVYDMNGKSLRGERMTVEIASGRPRGGRGRDYRGGSNSRSRYDRPPTRSDYQISIENLSSRVSWKDLKELISKEDISVIYADAHKLQRHQAIVEFKSSRDLHKAVRKFDGKEIQGRVIEIKVTKEGSKERSESPDRSRRKRKHSGSDSNDDRSPRRDRDSESPPPSKQANYDNDDDERRYQSDNSPGRPRSQSPKRAQSAGRSSPSYGSRSPE